MNTTIKQQENIYTNLRDLYENYIPAAMISFEGDTYERKENLTKSDTLIHVYRCENELLTLKIQIKNGSPLLIDGKYEM